MTSAVEIIAVEFHDAYEQLAPQAGWETQVRSRKAWQDVPLENRRLMLSVVAELLDRGVIEIGPRTWSHLSNLSNPAAIVSSRVIARPARPVDTAIRGSQGVDDGDDGGYA